MNNMAEANMALLSSFRGCVVDKRASARVVDLSYGQNSTEGLLQKILISLRSMKMLLEDLEGKEVMNPYVKKSMDDLRGYDAEDILDQIAREILRRRKHAIFKPVTGEVRNFISITFLHPFVRPVEAKIILKHLAKQKDVMDLQLGVGGKQYPDQRLTTSYVVESDTFGRDEDKKKVIDLLLPSDVGGGMR